MIHDSPSYHGPRPDIRRYVVSPKRVLDVGCNRGALARALRQEWPAVRVWGIDANAAALQEARPYLEEAWCLDLDNTEALAGALADMKFDHIIAADVLEHTVHFERITGILYHHLDLQGQLLISVPNYGHWHLLWVFLMRRWPRNDRGIFDRTHRSIIMWRNLSEFKSECQDADLVLLRRNFRFLETNRFPRLNRALTLAVFPLWFLPYANDLVTHQYILAIRRSTRSSTASGERRLSRA